MLGSFHVIAAIFGLITQSAQARRESVQALSKARPIEAGLIVVTAMSFKFNWRFFDVEDLQNRCQVALTESIAQTQRPPSIVAPIRAMSIDFGTVPPRLKLHSIPAVSLNRAHIVFELRYKGDATLTLQTEIQANVLDEPLNDPLYPAFVRPHVIGALAGLTLPFRLTIKELELETLVDVVYTPHGVVVNFQENPLKNLEVESSMDAFPFAHEMINTMLKQQLTVSFYEDIPESVWTSTSPTKQPPDPFFGARRWSQHSKKLAKFTASLFNLFPSRPMTRTRPFDTLALNPNNPNLAHPRAILNRACLSKLQATKTAAELQPTMEKVSHLLEESSSVMSSSSYASTRTRRPKRRVISLKKVSQALSTPSPSPSPATPPVLHQSQPPTMRSVSEESEMDVGTNSMIMPPSSTSTGTSLPATTITPPPAERKPFSRTSLRDLRRDLRRSSPKSPTSNPHTPLLQSSDCATFTDDEDYNCPTPEIPLLPPSLNWEHRRFSTPEEAQPMIRQRPYNKQRTISLQPRSKTSIHQAGLQRTPPLPRSPGRYSSTNDLLVPNDD